MLSHSGCHMHQILTTVSLTDWEVQYLSCTLLLLGLMLQHIRTFVGALQRVEHKQKSVQKSLKSQETS